MSDVAVVVGGGISGILSAIMLKSSFSEVYLIEKDKELGGLLRSYETPQGFSFDMGTHFPRQTGIADLDSILFKDMISSHWLELPYLKAGNYFCHKLNELSPFPDLRNLSPSVYENCLNDLLNTPSEIPQTSSLDDYVLQKYGNHLKSHLFKPFLEKIYHCPLSQLDWASQLHGLDRFVVLNANRVRKLKKEERLDTVLAFHSYEERTSTLKNFYPMTGGVHRWIRDLSHQLSEIGVRVLLNESVNEVHHQSGCVNQLTLKNKKRIQCDLLVWTVPSQFFMNFVQFPKDQTRGDRPKILFSSLHHYVYNQPFNTDLFYVNNFDPHLKTYRVTLYNNIQKSIQNDIPSRLTVEVLAQDESNLDHDSICIEGELKQMGIVDKSASCLFKKSIGLHQGFPRSTIDFVRASRRINEYLNNNFENVEFLGRGSGEAFFMNDVLRQTYSRLLKRVKLPAKSKILSSA